MPIARTRRMYTGPNAASGREPDDAPLRFMEMLRSLDLRSSQAGDCLAPGSAQQAGGRRLTVAFSLPGKVIHPGR